MADESNPPMTDNAALNAIVVELQNIEAFFLGAYDTLDGDGAFVAVSNTSPVTRPAIPTCVKRVVSNKGPSVVRVYENNFIVMLVPPGQTREVPLNGAGLIKIDCINAGETSQVAVAAFRNTTP